MNKLKNFLKVSFLLTFLLFILFCWLHSPCRGFENGWRSCADYYNFVRTKTKLKMDNITSQIAFNKTNIQLTLLKKELFTSFPSIRNIENRKTVIISSTWGAGSGIFGEVLGSHPAIFLHLEPLKQYGWKVPKSLLNESVLAIEELSNCKCEKLGYLYTDCGNSCWNSKVRSFCGTQNSTRFRSENLQFFSTACALYPIQVLTILRLSVESLEIFLKKSCENHIIVLIRDPRGLFAARLNALWCSEKQYCNIPDEMCKDLETMYISFKTLKYEYPDQVHLIKYEDAAHQPLKIFKRMFRDLQIPWHSSVEIFLETHTKKHEETNNLNTSIESITINSIDLWKTLLSKTDLNNIHSKCNRIMKQFSRLIGVI